MNLTDLHRRLLADVLDVGGVYPLVLTGGYAVQAHGLVNRLSQDLDVATESPERMEDIAAAVRTGLEERGWRVRALETDPLSARLIVTDPASREECEVDVLKETLWRPPVHTEHGLVLSLEDVVGTKVRALADRGLARDLVDVQAAADRAALSWKSSDVATPVTPSTCASFKHDWAGPTGSTTRSLPPTGSTSQRSLSCVGGHNRGPTTSVNDSRSWRLRPKTEGLKGAAGDEDALNSRLLTARSRPSHAGDRLRGG
ncbi:hypothetical protein SO3561_09873 [Streptomyces olivochromogenes]|uniref:Nucleotidyl transferase AbiEii/AbiGii toxin family protein n=1 Tax=Streptomyces olivochromogenes TaxID=1963 RepID=A0A250VVZ0_STROL|nr:hypothetical protein SO3561_09873 [Streptomyces olivochromogenes]